MRVLIATPLYPPEIGGPATYVRLLEDGFPKMGVEVQVLRFSDVRKYPKVVRHAIYFLKLVSKGREADMFLALDPVSTGVPAALATLFLRKPLALKIVGDYAWEQGRQRFGVTQSLDEFSRAKKVSFAVSILRKVETWVANRSQVIIVPSDYLKGIVAAWGIPQEKITVIPNAVTLTVGAVPEAVKSLPKPHILTVARLVPWKGIDGIINAVAQMRERGIDVSLIIAGEGPARETLEEQAKTRLKDGYLFIGVVPQPEVHALLKDADLFVLNSSYEGLSHVLIEALASGVPIVATDAGGNREVLANGSGILITAGDTDALSAAMADTLSNKDARERMRLAAGTRATAFTVSGMLERTKAVLGTL